MARSATSRNTASALDPHEGGLRDSTTGAHEGAVTRPLLDYYRLAPSFADWTTTVADTGSAEVGFFKFGPRSICFGRSQSGVAASFAGASEFDASLAVTCEGSTVRLPLCFSEVIDNLRLERYRQMADPGRGVSGATASVRSLYYFMRRCLPVQVRRQLQRLYFHGWEQLPFPSWPVDFTVDDLHRQFLRLMMTASGQQRVPFIWFWPHGAPNCLMMTHDVETAAGRDFTSRLMDLDDAFGIKASFQVIPEKRYDVPDSYVREIRDRGFEFNLHDLNHDGHLYGEREEFKRRAAKINGYVRKYNARGFRAGAMYRNQDWYDAFDFSYDMSVPNVAHLEPMRGGCCTVMPYFVGRILELPLTLAQDYSLFHILGDYSTDLWKQQLALIAQQNGLMSFITHPDYLIEPRARDVYRSLLEHLREMTTQSRAWAALPGEVDQWWRARSQMTLRARGSQWEIVGPDSERARVAYAVLDNGHLVYEVAPGQT